MYFGPETLFFAEQIFCVYESGIERESGFFSTPTTCFALLFPPGLFLHVISRR